MVYLSTYFKDFLHNVFNIIINEISKSAKEASTDMARERPVLGADRTKIFSDKYKVRKHRSFSSKQDLVLPSVTSITTFSSFSKKENKAPKKKKKILYNNKNDKLVSLTSSLFLCKTKVSRETSKQDRLQYSILQHHSTHRITENGKPITAQIVQTFRTRRTNQSISTAKEHTRS